MQPCPLGSKASKSESVVLSETPSLRICTAVHRLECKSDERSAVHVSVEGVILLCRQGNQEKGRPGFCSRLV